MKSLKKIVSWIMTLTLICAAIPLLNQSVAEAEGAPGKTYFVSLTGNDNAPGTIEEPFATLEKARDTIRSLSDDEKKDGVTVYLREGNYKLEETFKLTAKDTGTESGPIVYTAYEGETVTLSGQVTLNNDKFTIVTEDNADTGIWERLRSGARGNVVVYDLGAEEIPTGEVLNSCPTIYVDGTARMLAAYDSSGTIKYLDFSGDYVVEPGWSPIDSADKGDGLGERPFVLSYDGHDVEKRINNYWYLEDEVYLEGNFAYEWRLSDIQVKIDREKKTITSVENYTTSKDLCKFYAYNILSELTRNTEYYIDRSIRDGERTDKLYLYIKDGNVEGKNITMTFMEDPLLNMKNLSYVSFQGINFKGTLDNAISISNCESCEIKNADIQGCKTGVTVKNGHNVVISNCSIHDLNGNAVTLNGGDFTTLEASGHVLEYCDIYNTSGIAVSLAGVGQIVRRNHFYDLPLGAISFSGNDHLMEFNDIEHVCYNTSDAGAIYAGRNWTYRGNVIRYNYFHDNEWKNVIYAVYLDDAMSSADVYCNVIANWWMQGVTIGGGRDNKVHDNIYIDTPGWKIAANDRAFSDWFNTYLVSDPSMEKPFNNEYWTEKYPLLAATYGHMAEVWDEEEGRLMPDKSLRDVDEPDILNPLYPTGNKVFNEISVGTVNDWATLTCNDMPLISELGDFQMPQMLYDTPEAQDAYMQALSNGIRTATMEQMDAWKADYVSTLSDTAPTE